MKTNFVIGVKYFIDSIIEIHELFDVDDIVRRRAYDRYAHHFDVNYMNNPDLLYSAKNVESIKKFLSLKPEDML